MASNFKQNGVAFPDIPVISLQVTVLSQQRKIPNFIRFFKSHPPCLCHPTNLLNDMARNAFSMCALVL